MKGECALLVTLTSYTVVVLLLKCHLLGNSQSQSRLRKETSQGPMRATDRFPIRWIQVPVLEEAESSMSALDSFMLDSFTQGSIITFDKLLIEIQ